MLELRDVSSGYGELLALRDCSLRIEPGEVVALLGANGAGKSTTLRTISGVLRARAGAIRFEGRDLTGLRPEEVVRTGLVHVPEGRDVFASLTVRENLEAGGLIHGTAGRADDLARVHELFPLLSDRATQLAGSLSGGEQQMLAIGRGLMARPRLLMLDEPSLGLAPVVIERIFDALDEINEAGTTVLLVEQNARLALESSDRAYVLNAGRIVLEGASAELMELPEVRAAYLGAQVETEARA